MQQPGIPGGRNIGALLVSYSVRGNDTQQCHHLQMENVSRGASESNLRANGRTAHLTD